MLQWCAKSSIIKSWLSENAVHAAEFGLLLIGQLWRLATQLSLWPRDGHAFTTSQVGRRADPRNFGHGEATGVWFLQVNVWCGHFALNGAETSAWDDWRAAAQAKRVIGGGVDLPIICRRSRRSNLTEVRPDWLD